MTAYQRSLAAIDAMHDQDPAAPAERRYAERMSDWLECLVPEADGLLRLAVRAQHLRRWERPRADYPGGRAGYLAWRRDAAAHHGALVSEAMRGAGYRDDAVARVVSLVRKRRLASDPDAQALEDCACLVFLEHELPDFLARHPRETVISVIAKTWRKMSPGARRAAAALTLDDACKAVLAEAAP